MPTKKPSTPPIIVIYGDEEHQKNVRLTAALDELLPADVDRALAFTSYDGDRSADQGGPSIACVLEDLATLPFLSDRRVVLIRTADSFVTAHRERLEDYLAKPAPTGVLVLECRSFPKTTRLYKAAITAGGVMQECKRLFGRAVVEFVVGEARNQGKRIDNATAAQLIDLVGPEAGLLAGEIEKLCLYIGDRPAITANDISDLVGQSREEKIFAVADAAAAGRLPQALKLWNQVLRTDPDAPYKALGGLAFVVRRWLAAHQAVANGASVSEIAPKFMMWGRDRELDALLRRLTAPILRDALAALADLDAQAKSGTRSIETGIELWLVRLAAPAA